jgi:hypothetical protein
MNINIVCSSYVICLCDEHEFRMFIILWEHGIYCDDGAILNRLQPQDIVCHLMTTWYLHNIATRRLFSSHCNDEAMFDIVCHLMTTRYLHNIMTRRLCSSHCDVWKCLSHCDNRICVSHCNMGKSSSYCDDRSMNDTFQCFFVFNTLQRFVHIAPAWICSSHYDVSLCLSHCNVAMFVTMRHREMFDILCCW